MRLFSLMMISALLILSAGQVLAQADAGRIEIRPFLGYRLGGSIQDGSYESDTISEIRDHLDVKPGAQYGLMINVPFSKFGMYDPENNWMLEAFVALQTSPLRIDEEAGFDLPDEFTRDGDKIELFDMDVHYIHVGVLHQWTQSSLNPYLNFTLGAARFDPEGEAFETKTEFSLGLGGGVKRYFSDRFAFRLQLRGFLTFLGTDETDAVYCDPYGCWTYEENITFTQFEISSGISIGL